VKRVRGATLVEMIMFIVIIGVVVAGLIVGFTHAVRSGPQSKLMTEGLERAKERLELIQGQRVRLGFAGFTAATYDPCATGSVHPACSEATVSVCFYTGAGVGSTCSFGNATACFANDTDYKCVRVRAVDGSGSILAELDEAFGNF
jgi:hypothetical protein